MNSSKYYRIFILACLVLQAVTFGANSAPISPKQFETPVEAAKNLIEAAASFHVPALREILGSQADDLIASEDPVMDKARAVAFAEKAQQKQSIEIDPKHPNRAILAVGEDGFPLPIPLIKHKHKWSFDTQAGMHEILLRRIGANELDAIEICRGFFEAQQEYVQTKHDGSLVNQYAQHILSTPGKQDGLAWQNADGTWGGPVGEVIARALDQGYTDKTQPYHGYYFKVLKGQGPASPMGKIDFVVGGAMLGGFALAAAPAQYRVTGVKTFIVSHTGIVYEKDLGPKTLEIFQKMDCFNPDNSWQSTDDQW